MRLLNTASSASFRAIVSVVHGNKYIQLSCPALEAFSSYLASQIQFQCFSSNFSPIILSALCAGTGFPRFLVLHAFASASARMSLARFKLSSAVFLGLAFCVKGQNLTTDSTKPSITTPMSVVHCAPIQLTVGGGKPPYFVSILPGGEPAALALETFPTLQEPGGITWVVDQAPGKNLTFQVRDSDGNINYSQATTVMNGGDCSKVPRLGLTPPGPAVGNATAGPTQNPVPTNATATAAPLDAAAPLPKGNAAAGPTEIPAPSNTTATAAPLDAAASLVKPNATGPTGTANPTNITAASNTTLSNSGPRQPTPSTSKSKNSTSVPASTKNNTSPGRETAKHSSAISFQLSPFDRASKCGLALSLTALLIMIWS